jgi:hypothetical protein
MTQAGADLEPRPVWERVSEDFHRLAHDLHHEVQRLERTRADQEETIELCRREVATAKAEAGGLRVEVDALRAKVAGLQARVAGLELAARETLGPELPEGVEVMEGSDVTEEELQRLAGESWSFFAFTGSAMDQLTDMMEDFGRSGHYPRPTLARFSAGQLWTGERAIAVFFPRDSLPREVMHAGLRKYMGYENPGPGDFIFTLGIEPGDDDALQRRGGRFLK